MTNFRYLRRRMRESLSPARDYAQLPHRDRPPIVVLGFNKTGTTSLHEWFMDADIRSLHHGGYHAKNNAAVRIEMNVKNGRDPLHSLEHFEAVSDLHYQTSRKSLDGNRYFREFYESHPNAYFILNHRPVEDWIKSRRTHGDGSLMVRETRLHAMSSAEVEVLWQRLYVQRLKDIRTFFAHKDARFLDVEMNDGASAKIAAFLAPDYALSPEILGHHNRNKFANSAHSAIDADAQTGVTPHG